MGFHFDCASQLEPPHSTKGIPAVATCPMERMDPILKPTALRPKDWELLTTQNLMRPCLIQARTCCLGRHHELVATGMNAIAADRDERSAACLRNGLWSLHRN